MNHINTVSDYLNMKSSEKKKFIKGVLKEASKDQQALLARYEQAVANKEIAPVS
ncbi:MAG: hypothetical protein AAB383_01225 [Patescibacteria group bacterium]